MPQPLEIKRAPELEGICYRLIELFYSQFEDAQIVVVYRSKRFPDKPNCVARIEKATGVKAFLWSKRDGEQSMFFLIQVVEPNWYEKSGDQQIAILDHELCHIDVSETTGELDLRDHPIEEFPEIVGRHGSYHTGLEIFAEALERGNLSDRKALIEQILSK